MRTLTSTLLAAQKEIAVTGKGYRPLWKIYLSYSTLNHTYTSRDRFLSVKHIEQDDNYSAEVVLDNHDNALTSLNLEQWQADLYYGYATSAGDEYSKCAPMQVVGQQLFDAQGQLKCHLELKGAPNLMRDDLARSERTFSLDDQNTVKDLYTAIADTTIAGSGASVHPYSTYTAYTVTYDSEDSIIDIFKPADYFRITMNDSRWKKLSELLSYTGCKLRIENDGEIHILVPTTSGASYDYEYKLLTEAYHAFLTKTLRHRFITPNYETVQSLPEQGFFSGSASSAISYALSPQYHTTYARLQSNAMAQSIAEAIIQNRELNANTGGGLVPMNCGQELWDYVNITSSRESDNKAGNVRYIERLCDIKKNIGQGGFDMIISFGRPPRKGLGLFVDISEQDSINSEFRQAIDYIYEDLDELLKLINSLYEYLIPGDGVVFNKLYVIEKLNIPHWTE